ncbi:hypothetical protein HCN51_31585 [Nonomuraea sp. FMUSA5-5]|uniref:Uncharacterized protein n=1 Tax=Nonomuraea composti TaxID=2720023 RepID=A0ABX1BC14_9ACTN|nr:hypothetical protein [Nonomuraea sp. FMUSA5-5]NJP93927.1 hypothetical protein [Nonomuraea sp. FMUSA5-5]
MADTPDERLLAMTQAVAGALDLLMQVAIGLPVPIKLPLPTSTDFDHFFEALGRMRVLIEDEPIPGHAIGHLDQAVLMIQTSMDLIHIAASHDEIDWRYDAVHLHCAAAAANLALTQMILNGQIE